MSLMSEFKEFAAKGNVLQLAVAFVMGVAFGAITKSLVADIIMPPIGLMMGNLDFSNLYINLGGGDFASLAAAEEAGAPIIKYGLFINNVLDFIIVAFAIFMVIRAMNKLKKAEEEAPPPAPPAVDTGIEERIAKLEAEVAALRRELAALSRH